jgi:hypothetical protein
MVTGWHGRRGGVGRLKKLSRALVVALVLVAALAGFNVTIPAGRPAASNLRFVLTHPAILLHVIVRRRDRPWIAVSAGGLVFVVLAFVAGEEYVMSLQKGALDYMSLGWAGAVTMYGTGWYLGRKKERQTAKANARES